MKDDKHTAGRRAWLAGLVLAAGTALAAFAGFSLADSRPAADDIVVYKSPYCGCCKKWIAQLESAGLTVDAVDVDSTAAAQADAGVPRELRSCHTGRIGDYWVEGHVPPDLVVDLLNNKPAGVRGLSVPGMPRGSAGMEGPNPQRYQVLRVMTDGRIEVHAVRDGRATAP